MRVLSPRLAGAWQGAASFLVFLGLWAAAAALSESRLFPGPAAVARSIIAEAEDGTLFLQLGITLARVAVSFAVAMALGTALGIALGRSPRLDRWLHPWVVVLLNVPAHVVIILTYVWLGLVETALLVAVAANKIPNVAVTLREGARALDRDLAEMAQVYRLGPWTTLREVILPQLAPYLLAAARNGLALIWKIVLVVELLGRPDGVGYAISYHFQLFDVSALLGYSLVFTAIMLAADVLVLQPLEVHARRWRPSPDPG